jgi:hypothetical protein
MTIRDLFADVLDYSVTSVLGFVGLMILAYAAVQLLGLLIFYLIDRKWFE